VTGFRQELKDALAIEGQEPIRWLGERLAAGRRQGSGTEVLESLQRELERCTTTKSGKRRAMVKRWLADLR